MKKKKIILNVGIPGSGKTTATRKIVEGSGGRIVRVNKDDIREQIHGNMKFTKEREKVVVNIEDVMIREAICQESVETVYVDDTNLHDKHFYRISKLANEISSFSEFDIEVYQVFFDDSLDVDLCHKRNEGRDRTVPHGIVENMYRQYMRKYLSKEGIRFPMLDEQGRAAYIFDIDGTLADHTGLRYPFDEDLVGRDRPKKETINYLNMLSSAGNMIILTSGRTERCRRKTEDWLVKHGVLYDQLHMRGSQDRRKDFIVKFEMYRDNIFPDFNVKLVIDDRDQVVRMWRAIGLECWQVGAGNF